MKIMVWFFDNWDKKEALYIEGEKMQFDFTKEKTRGDSLTEKPASVRISESSNQGDLIQT